MFEEVLFLHGCPHCGDGEPAIVTLVRHEIHDDSVTYLNVEPEVIEALKSYPTIQVMACKKVIG